MAEGLVVPEDRSTLYDTEIAEGVSWIDSIALGADAILGAIIDVAAMNDVELPSSQFIYVGTPAKDCEQVAVTVGSYGFGRPGDPMAGPGLTGNDEANCWLPGVVQYTAEITRCVPEDNTPRTQSRYGNGLVLPDTVAKEAHAKTVMRDMMILLEAGNVASNYPYPSAGSEANVLVADPQGGYQSVFLTVSIQV